MPYASRIDQYVEADIQRAAPGDVNPGTEAAVVRCDVIHRHAGRADEAVLGVGAIFADVDEDAGIGVDVRLGEIDVGVHAVGAPDIVGAEGSAAEIGRSILAARFLSCYLAFLGQILDFRLRIAAATVFFLRVHACLLVDKVGTAPVCWRGAVFILGARSQASTRQ